MHAGKVGGDSVRMEKRQLQGFFIRKPGDQRMVKFNLKVGGDVLHSPVVVEMRLGVRRGIDPDEPRNMALKPGFFSDFSENRFFYGFTEFHMP